MLMRPLTHPQAADATPAQPDAQAEAPQRTIDTSDAEPHWIDLIERDLARLRSAAAVNPNRSILASIHALEKQQRRLHGVWLDEVFIAPADDVPVDREGE